MKELGRACALVALVLHTPVTVLEDVTVDELMEWLDDAVELGKRLYGKRG